jgi:hypothetical protein
MKSPFHYPLDRVRTDGWFERVGQSVPSFQALCEILGERFFAFSLIAGVRISALTVDRRRPENTLVEFVVGAEEGGTPEQVPLREFQGRLVSALLLPSPPGPVPARADDVDGIQQFIGPHFLLLAPLYGCRLLGLIWHSAALSEITYLAEDLEYTVPLEEFRESLRERVQAELQYAAEASEGASLDLGQVNQAQALFDAGDHDGVRALLATWPATLTILLRTPDAHALLPDTRAALARALSMLAASCATLGDTAQAEEVFRLAVQYAGDGPVAGQVYERLGRALLDEERPGEAIGSLRRAAALGAERAWAPLAEAFLARGRLLAALGAVAEARAHGAASNEVDGVLEQVEERLGPALGAWRTLLRRSGVQGAVA